MAVLVFIAFSIPVTLLRGWVLQSLWAWFITPVIGIRNVSVGEAVGLSLLITFLTYHESSGREERSAWEMALASLVAGTLLSLYALVAGWMVHVIIT